MTDSAGNTLPYIDRDVSWMYFNHRILQEAMRENVPLLERLSFLGIYSNNLDEFFRVRMATLARLATMGGKTMLGKKRKPDNCLAASATWTKNSLLNMKAQLRPWKKLLTRMGFCCSMRIN